MYNVTARAGLLRALRECKLSGSSILSVCTVSLAWLGLSDPSHAQHVELQDITVIGTRTEVSVFENPRSVSVVDQEQLQRQAPLSIAQALRDVPGVELVDAGVPGMKRLRIRGESSRRVTILVDGQEITDHSSYGTPILINPAAVERIDVIRGPSSVLWGAKAIGGVIDIITKKGVPGKAAELELGGSYYSGTNGKQGWASLSGTVDNFDYRVTGGIAEYDDQRTPIGQFTSTGRLDNTEFENDDISAHLGFTFGASNNHYLAVKAEQYRLESESWTDPATITGSPPDVAGVTDFTINLPQRDRKKVGVYYDGRDLGGPVTKLHFDAYYQTLYRLFDNNVGQFEPGFTIPLGPFAPPIVVPGSTTSVLSTSDDTLTNYGATGQIDLELLPRHYTIFGVQYLADVLETYKTSLVDQTPGNPFVPPGTFPSFNESFTKSRIDTLSFFAQDTWELVDNLKLIAGVRVNRIENELQENRNTLATLTPGSSSDTEVSSSVALTYTGFQNTTLRALYSSGYISPTLIQLYGRTSAGGQTAFGNPDLELETADNFELGYRYDGNGLVVDLVGYYTKSKDYITTVDCGIEGPDCPENLSRGEFNSVFVNVDEAETHGVELLVQYTLPGTTITPYASGAYTRRKLQYADFSTYNTNVPLVSGRFGVRYEWDVAGINAWADLFARASSDVQETELDIAEDEVTTDEVDSWATLNFAFGGTYGEDDKYRLVVQVNNITDEEYRPLTDALPGVGRSVQVTAAVKF